MVRSLVPYSSSAGALVFSKKLIIYADSLLVLDLFLALVHRPYVFIGGLESRMDVTGFSLIAAQRAMPVGLEVAECKPSS
jgi:hypothetical protein